MLPETSTWNAFSPPMMPDPFAQPGAYGQPVPPNFGQPAPYGQPSPYGQAVPYAQPTPYAPYAPYGAAPPVSGGFTVPGANGPQPYRLGWQNRLNISWMPTTRVSGGATGGFEQFGVDYDLAHTGPCLPGWISTWTNQFRLRNWDGPVGGAGLPGDAYRFGVDYEVETPQTGPYSLSLGITPSINSDLNASVSSDAFQLDGRGIMLFQLDRYWTVGLGAQFWDRVNDRVIPYAGLIYRDDFWEWRLMFPESQISLFLGNEPYWSKWAYVRAEYHVEAYEISTATGTGRDEVELEDWRAMFGFRMDAGACSWFIEAGWVFDREIDYSNAANASVFPGTGFLTQAGWRF